MSSARNHRIRSHRSYKNKVAMLGSLEKKSYIRGNAYHKNGFFAKLLKLFSKGK